MRKLGLSNTPAKEGHAAEEDKEDGEAEEDWSEGEMARLQAGLTAATKKNLKRVFIWLYVI